MLIVHDSTRLLSGGSFIGRLRDWPTFFIRWRSWLGMALFFFAGISCSLAEKSTVSGVVLDALGKPVAGAQVATFWSSQKGVMKPYDEATTDDQGQFELEIENYGRPVALLAIDGEQEHGQFIALETLNSGTPLTLRLRPLITLRGDLFCEELGEAPSWSNVYINVTTNGIRLAQDYSVPSKFELKLPPGEYELNGYGGEEVSGTYRQVTLSPDKPLVDLGRVNLAATPIGLLWGKPAPAWNITEARGVSANVTLADFRGKWLLLDFWGYWCGPCIRAMPELMRFYEDHASDRNRFEVLAIHVRGRSLREMDERLKLTVRDLWKGHTLPFPILLDATDRSTAAFGIQHFPSQVLIDPDGRIVRDGDADLLKRILDSQGKPSMPVAASNDGSLLAVASNSIVEVFDPHAGRCVLTLKAGKAPVHCAAFFHDDGRVVTGGADGTVRLWNLATGQQLGSFEGEKGAVFALAVSPDGKTLASAGFDTLHLWDVQAVREKETLSAHLFPCWSVAFSPDGRQVAAGGAGTVKVWDVATGDERVSLRDSQTELIHSLAFSSDGQTLAVGRGKSVVLWSLATGQRQAVLKGLSSEVVYVAFAHDGKTVTALSRGKAIRSWSTLYKNEEVSVAASALQSPERLAARLPDDPEALNAEAWEVVRRVGQPSLLYERALRQAQIAAADSPRDKASLTTLGTAQYRVGAFSNAAETLGRAESIKNEEERRPPVERFFRAMAQQKLGQTQSATVMALGLWSLWLAPDSDAKSVFVEMNETLFGPNAETGRELVLRLFAAGKSAPAIEAALNDNAKLTHDLRSTAIGLIPAAQTYCLVRREQKKLLLRSLVVQAVEHWTSLTAEWRQMALALAEQTQENAEELNEASWAVVSRPGRSDDQYQLALAQAQAAYGHTPNDGIRNTLGVAQYRAGKYLDAIGTLGESERANAEGIAAPADLPFLAMAFHKAGKLEEAKKRFNQLAELLAKSPTRNSEMRGWLNEVEKVFGKKLEHDTQP